MVSAECRLAHFNRCASGIAEKMTEPRSALGELYRMQLYANIISATRFVADTPARYLFRESIVERPKRELGFSELMLVTKHTLFYNLKGDHLYSIFQVG